MKKVIFNADDFGWNNSITDAIIKAHVDGIISSTTIMVNMDGFNYAVRQAKSLESLGVGIHFNLTEGYPISNPESIPLLLNDKGKFNNDVVQKNNFLFGKYQYEQIKIELNNQLTMLFDNGISPTHFDSHHHITAYPLSFKASMEVAESFNLMRARITKNKSYYHKNINLFQKLSQIFKIIKYNLKVPLHNYYKARLRSKGFITPDIKLVPFKILPILDNEIEQFKAVLELIGEGISEISLHPDFPDSNDTEENGYEMTRKRDFRIATNKEIIKYVGYLNLNIVNYHNGFES